MLKFYSNHTLWNFYSLKNNLTKGSQVAIKSAIYLFFNIFVRFAFRIAKVEKSYNLQLFKTCTTAPQGSMC